MKRSTSASSRSCSARLQRAGRRENPDPGVPGQLVEGNPRHSRLLLPLLLSDGAAPQAPGVRLRGPHSPAPLPPRRAVRGINQTGLRPEPPASACGDPFSPAPLPPRRAVRGIIQMGLRPKPPASVCGDPAAPRRSRRGAPCAASIRRGCAPNPRRPLAGTPQPRAAPAEARRARLAESAPLLRRRLLAYKARRRGLRARDTSRVRWRRPAPAPPRRSGSGQLDHQPRALNRRGQAV